MRTIQLLHDIHCSVETFWKVFLDREFNETLFRKELGFPQYDIIDVKETDTEIVRRVKGNPKTSAPRAVQKLMGDGFGYSEEGRMKRGDNLWTFKITPNTLAEKITNEGYVKVEPAGEDKVKRISELKFEARIFGVGGMVESTAEKDFREGYDASAVFMNRWIQERI
jgi:hypothetical protein